MADEPTIPDPPDPEYRVAKKDPAFSGLPDRTSSIWRYMDIAKFLSLLDTGALFFARLDKLGDPFQGSLTRSRELKRQQFRGLHRDNQTMVESNIVNTIVNCWHMNDSESDAMWTLYAAFKQGLAIRSTIERLIASFPSLDGEQPKQEGYWLPTLLIRIGAVEYVDFETFEDTDKSLTLLKRKSFAHEREIRAVVSDCSFMGDPHADHPRFPNAGDYVQCDVKTLIEYVYVAPSSPAWFKRAVESLIRQYGYDFQVRQSALDEAPIH